jgi:hypothetical protein
LGNWSQTNSMIELLEIFFFGGGNTSFWYFLQALKDLT